MLPSREGGPRMREWWGSDIVPRIQWVVRKSGIRRGLSRYGKEGNFYPPGYGYAWRDPLRKQDVLMPIPINIIARTLRDFWWALKGGWPYHKEDPVELAAETGFWKGVQHWRAVVVASRVVVKNPRPENAEGLDHPIMGHIFEPIASSPYTCDACGGKEAWHLWLGYRIAYSSTGRLSSKKYTLIQMTYKPSHHHRCENCGYHLQDHSGLTTPPDLCPYR